MAEATVVTPAKGSNTKYWVRAFIGLLILAVLLGLLLGGLALRDNINNLNKGKDEKIATLEKDLAAANARKCEGCAKPKATHIPTRKKAPRAARPTQPAQPVQVERVRLVEVNPFKKMEEACRGKTMVRHPDGTIECNTPQQFVQQVQQVQQPVCNPPNRWSQGPIQGKVRCLTAEDYAAMYAPRQQVQPVQQYVQAPQGLDCGEGTARQQLPNGNIQCVAVKEETPWYWSTPAKIVYGVVGGVLLCKAAKCTGGNKTVVVQNGGGGLPQGNTGRLPAGGTGVATN